MTTVAERKITMLPLVSRLAVVLALASAGVAGVSSRAVADGREIDGSSAVSAAELVGWYVLDDGSYRMMAWGASEGVTFVDFARAEQARVVAARDGAAKLVSAEGAEFALRVRTTDSGAVESVAWIDGRGRERTARKTTAYGYDIEEVRYRNGDVELAGLLLTPRGTGPFPAIAVAHGEGDVDRENFWYLSQADYLARRGIAVLLPDKRGCGKSGGSWEGATFEVLAGDALAGVRLLRGRDRIDPSRVGVVGLSEGGWIAPVAAVQSKDVRFIVSVSGSAVSPDEQMRHELAADIRSYGTPDFLVPLITFALERREKHRREEWWALNGDFDVLSYWRRLTQPALAVFGSNDERESVPVHRSVTRLEDVRASSPGADMTIHVFPNTGHEMDDPTTGRTRAEYLELLATWILDRAA